ncbi:MAG: UDP-3-O-(3-hydroxymyristoyl)glucosamine N-acyltransferase [Acidobacteria bacterium]|jgi:UDP-3-O-[3-hydroxymyristoyl] glucosamine N-acyltransferase|nr:UDP-3-O-(3-hydroxymyristoyl)glucosamine N-acyltransferase [Acidobacteriota bacterium]
MKIEKIAEILNEKFVGEGETEIFGAASLENARTGEISFVEKAEFSESAQNTKASCLIIPENFNAPLPCSYFKVKNPKIAFAKIAEILHQPKKQSGIHSTAQIVKTAKIGKEVFIGAFSVIGENTEIGDNTQIFENVKIAENTKIGADCFIFPNVVIYENVSIGNNVKLHAGVVVGADGFGFVRDAERYIKFPQIGSVVIEDEVEIGANSCIDRGALGETRIGKGTKIDNLVQIGHNVQIGKRVVIAAQTGISGSTIIEDDCVIGGQVGFGDHATVKSGAIIGSKAGILPGKIVRQGVWWGVPVQPLDEYKRQNAYVKSLPRMREEIKVLKKQVAALEVKKTAKK